MALPLRVCPSVLCYGAAARGCASVCALSLRCRSGCAPDCTLLAQAAGTLLVPTGMLLIPTACCTLLVLTTCTLLGACVKCFTLESGRFRPLPCQSVATRGGICDSVCVLCSICVRVDFALLCFSVWPNSALVSLENRDCCSPFAVFSRLGA